MATLWPGLISAQTGQIQTSLFDPCATIEGLLADGFCRPDADFAHDLRLIAIASPTGNAAPGSQPVRVQSLPVYVYPAPVAANGSSAIRSAYVAPASPLVRSAAVARPVVPTKAKPLALSRPTWGTARLGAVLSGKNEHSGSDFGLGVEGSLRLRPFAGIGANRWFIEAGAGLYPLELKVANEFESKHLRDVYYKFGYEDWRPKSFSLFYQRRETTRPQDLFERPLYGELVGRYRFGWRGQNLGAFAFDDSSAVRCDLGAALRPRWEDASGAKKNWKTVGTFDCRYQFLKNYFIEAGVRLYPDGHQLPWDRDFDYAFGYEENRNGGWSIVYSNYANNRFNKPASFFDGKLKISRRWDF